MTHYHHSCAGCTNGILIPIEHWYTRDAYLETITGWTRDLCGGWLCPRCGRK